MYLTEYKYEREIWIDPARVETLIPHGQEKVEIIFSSGQRLNILWLSSLDGLVKKLGLVDRVVSHGIALMQVSGTGGPGWIIVRNESPKYWGEQGWDNDPLVFEKEVVARSIADHLA